MASLLHVRIEKSESIKVFMQCFGAVILQLDTVSSDTVMHAIKQGPHTQFFDSLSLHPLTIGFLGWQQLSKQWKL